MSTETSPTIPKPNQGYYPPPGWEWQKPDPKTYLVEHNLAQYAQAWILNVVELVHWTLFIPGFLLSFVIFSHASVLTEQLGSETQVFLLLLTPVIQVFAGLGPIVMHEYEGWQIAYFQNPLDVEFQVPDVNNEWLREIAYKMLFFPQTVGLVTFSLGVFGLNKFTITFGCISVLFAFLCPQNPKVTFQFNGQPVFPVALWLMVVFVINATLNLIAYFVLLGPALASAGLPSFLSVAPPILLLLGGVLEGVVAESTFNQWWHFIAVIFLNVAMVVQIFLFGLLW
ncbi:MAG: hypothetical protein ACPGVO_17505 [Spirulinaceae cyanobacterium]